MVSTAVKSQGATLALLGGGSPEYTTVANINNISLTGVEASDIDVTDLSSAAREFLQGLEDPGSIDITGFYDYSNAQHVLMRDAVGGSTASTYKITLSDGHTIIFSALVSSFTLDVAVDGAVEMNMTLKISGAITWSS